jgi:hypothetical protein
MAHRRQVLVKDKGICVDECEFVSALGEESIAGLVVNKILNQERPLTGDGIDG